MNIPPPPAVQRFSFPFSGSLFSEAGSQALVILAPTGKPGLDPHFSNPSFLFLIDVGGRLETELGLGLVFWGQPGGTCEGQVTLCQSGWAKGAGKGLRSGKSDV